MKGLLTILVVLFPLAAFSQQPRQTNSPHQKQEKKDYGVEFFYSKGIDFDEPAMQQASKMLQAMNGLQLEDYNNEAIRRVKALGRYLMRITDPGVPEEVRLKAAKMAKGLFIDQERNIEVTDSYPILEYIDRLLEEADYKVQMEWSNIHSKMSFNSQKSSKLVELDHVERMMKAAEIVESEINYDGFVDTLLVFEEILIYNEVKQFLKVRLGDIMLSEDGE